MPAATAEDGDKNESSPVQGDDPGVVCFPCNPCGRVRGREGDCGVAVVVDPGVVATNPKYTNPSNICTFFEKIATLKSSLSSTTN